MGKGIARSRWLQAVLLLCAWGLSTEGPQAGGAEDRALLETQRRVLGQTVRRLDLKSERLKKAETALEGRAGDIAHRLEALESLWERQHLILGMIKGDFFALRDLYLIALHLQKRLEDLIKEPCEERVQIQEDLAWTERVEQTLADYRRQYEAEWNEADAAHVLQLENRIQALGPRYARVLDALEREIRPVEAFLGLLQKRQTDIEASFSEAPRALFLKRGKDILSSVAWSDPSGQGRQWLSQIGGYIEEMFLVHAEIWIKLLAVGLLFSLGFFGTGLTLLRLVDRKTGRSLVKGLRSPLGWASSGVGLFLAAPATGVPAFALQGALIGLLLTRALLGLAFRLQAPLAESPLGRGRELKGLWMISFAGVVLAILEPPPLLYLLVWLTALASLAVTMERRRSLLSGPRLLVLLYLPLASCLAIFGWPYASIALGVVLFHLLLDWQIAFGLVKRFLTPVPVEEKGVKAGALARLTAPVSLSLLFVILVILTLPLVLGYLGGPFLLPTLLSYRVGWESISMQAGRILLVLVGLLFTKSAVGVINEGIAVRLEKGDQQDKGSIQALQTLSGYLLWFLFGMGVLYLIGFSLGNIAVITGGLSVGVGFGLQNIIHNFVGGMILLFSRPIQPGDLIDHGGKYCRVRKVSVRNTVVETFDGKTIFIPNADLISKEFSNWNHKDRRMRLTVSVGVSYATDPNLVRDTLLAIAKTADRVLQTPKPLVIFKDFGPSCLEFSLKFWIKGPGHLMTGSQLRYTIYETFKEKGIELAFPQLDVHLDRKNPPREGPPASKDAVQEASPQPA